MKRAVQITAEPLRTFNLDANVLQVWLGAGLPPNPVMHCMRRTRLASRVYTLVCEADSPLLGELEPDIHVLDTALITDASRLYPKAFAYLERHAGPRQASDVLRFAMLARNPEMLYIDGDCLLHTYGQTEGKKHVVLGRYKDEADIFLIHGGGDEVFFTSALSGLAPGQGPSQLRYMTRNHPHRFPVAAYTHLRRSRNPHAAILV